jgi:hypothetical protein
MKIYLDASALNIILKYVLALLTMDQTYSYSNKRKRFMAELNPEYR